MSPEVHRHEVGRAMSDAYGMLIPGTNMGCRTGEGIKINLLGFCGESSHRMKLFDVFLFPS